MSGNQHTDILAQSRSVPAAQCASREAVANHRTSTVCQQTGCLQQGSGGVCLPLVHMAGLAIVQSMTLHAGTPMHEQSWSTVI